MHLSEVSDPGGSLLVVALPRPRGLLNHVSP